MHAIKGAWAGRTYALANSNDSGGRKSRIRRSKEERKELVVSFIKRHQKLNNGSFPSLNLTHKEVGGSFYIVREIIREVIQENRVLAPPKLLPGEQNMESFLKQYPLGSISVDPQIDILSSNESQVLVNHHQFTNKEQVLDSRPITELDQGTLDNGIVVNGSVYEDDDDESKESEGPINVDLLLEKGTEDDEVGVKELDADLVTASNTVENVGEKTSSLEEHNVENFISIDHQIDVESLDKSEIEVGYHMSTNEDQVLDATHVSKSDQESYVNGTIANGSSSAVEASSFPEERDVENFLEQGPTTFSTIDHQIDVELVDESKFEVSYNKAKNEEQVLDSTDILLSNQGSLANDTLVNGSSKQVAESEELKELINGKSLLERGVDGDIAEVENFLEEGPTTISTTDNQNDVDLVDESEIGVSYDKATNEEQVLVSTDILLPDQGSLVNGTIVNESYEPVVESEEPKELIDGESLLERGVDGGKDEVKELEVYQTTSQAEESLVVETFPLRPVPQMNYDSDEELINSVVTVGVLKKQDTVGLKVEAVNNSVPEKALLTKESIACDVNGSTDLDARDTFPTANKPKVSANIQQATSDKAASNKQQFNIAEVGSSKTKGNNPTLDRPKLESWEATTEKSAGKEADNPLMAFIKAFMSAFVKFWSE